MYGLEELKPPENRESKNSIETQPELNLDSLRSQLNNLLQHERRFPTPVNPEYEKKK